MRILFKGRVRYFYVYLLNDDVKISPSIETPNDANILFSSSDFDECVSFAENKIKELNYIKNNCYDNKY